jgi:phage/plasmid-like protein (TIGR03299 family)
MELCGFSHMLAAMAHDIATVRGRPAMMYTGEPPWHGLGTRLNGPANSADAIKAAGLDWEVIKVPLFVKSRRSYERIKDRFATIRAEPGLHAERRPPFGIVGRSYVPLQNRDAFTWFDEIVGRKAAIYHTAGALGDGERVWILAKLPDVIRVIGDDIAEKFLLLSNSHDGTSSVQVKFTPIRVVCQNTLTMALSEGRSIRIHHTPGLERQLKLAQTNLGIIETRFGEIGRAFRRMQSVSMNTERLTKFVSRVLPDPKDEEDERGLALMPFGNFKQKRQFGTVPFEK